MAITRKRYYRFSSSWKGTVYQTWDKVSSRCALLDKVLPELEGKSVLDIGCNAASLGFYLSSHVSKYVGIEADKHFYAQALATRKRAPKKNMEIHNKAFGRFAKRTDERFDVVLTSNVLYWLKEAELQFLKDEFVPKAKLMVNIFRFRSKKDSRNRRRLYNEEGIRKYFDNVDFTIYKDKARDLYMMVGAPK